MAAVPADILLSGVFRSIASETSTDKIRQSFYIFVNFSWGVGGIAKKNSFIRKRMNAVA
ncbi:hypothetical protein [Xenorhabdus bovienii]|uniref:hypothetical protein n=1 Tax=Xenorhabdus bovienii TaxID=40576 RepID=UPI00237C8915|nr:hypothetical protein [Xenorhabdus bovienii]MDE1476376.1 hypothetical protein [Xenorhabdus bovienii]MDE1484265.1 hypothetical protein [Xenorhabdus bovienii]MDE9458883.1 hypothetical protein [Xenorhabdus bovienii]MDE9498216.1 hypothetical protein [Xenorhabdus bovienii]MDE9515852.1 hypothetical protein [Xenorhabdus bovienii]